MILFISHDGNRTGAPIVLFHLLKWLRKNTELEMKVLVRSHGPMVDLFSTLTETMAIEGPKPPKDKKLSHFAYRLRRRIKSGAPFSLPLSWRHSAIDLIYSNTVTNGCLVSTLARTDTPVITHVHEMSYWMERSGAENMRRVLDQTSRFIAVSRAVRDNLIGKFRVPTPLVDVVHEFIPALIDVPGAAKGVKKELGIPDDAFVVGGSGHESWRKGRDLFVQLAACVSRMLPSVDVHFIWVGYIGDVDDQRRLAHDAALAGIAHKVHWTGEVSDPTRYFKEFDVFAMVSREDPFPLVCLEAAAHGKPILCFADAGGIPELVEEDMGFVVPYLDLHSMAGRVVELVTNPTLTAQFGRTAKAKVLERHTVERAGPMILDIIERELKRTKKS